MPSSGMPIFLLLISMTSVTFGSSLAKKIFPIVGPAGATTLRLLVAAALLIAINRPWRFPISIKQWRGILIYGVALGLMNLSFYAALERIPLGLTVAIEFLGPLSVALWASRRPADILWAFLAGAGVFLLLPLTGLQTQRLDPIGIFYALLAGLSWALYIVSGRRASQQNDARAVTGWGMLFAALVVSPTGLITVGRRLWDPAILPIAIGVGIFSSALPYSLEMIALKALPARTFGILMSVEPALAGIWGVLILSEMLSFKQWLAMGFVTVASIGSASRRKME